MKIVEIYHLKEEKRPKVFPNPGDYKLTGRVVAAKTDDVAEAADRAFDTFTKGRATRPSDVVCITEDTKRTCLIARNIGWDKLPGDWKPM